MLFGIPWGTTSDFIYTSCQVASDKTLKELIEHETRKMLKSEESFWIDQDGLFHFKSKDGSSVCVSVV